MKKYKGLIIFLSVLGLVIVLFLTLFLSVWNSINNYIEASQPKITDDISSSESTLLLDEYGISLPTEAEITAFSFTEEKSIIRIEGVEDLPAFLTDSIGLGISTEDAEKIADNIYKCFDYDNSPYADMYGVEYQSAGLSTSRYPSCSLDSDTKIIFFLLEEKLTIEITRTNLSSVNRQALRDIVDK